MPSSLSQSVRALRESDATPCPRLLAYFLALPDAQLAAEDIAEINLACARTLPGTGDVDGAECLKALDNYADRVRKETDRSYRAFIRSPEEYENSQAYYCILVMISVLQLECGVRYNPARIHDPDFRDSRDLFLHGILKGAGGTCASMPVLYAAVGRRLSYPLKLAHAKGHVFTRWEDPEGRHPFGKERFNIEGSGHGLNCYPDEYYRTWPLPISEQELERGLYLRSLTPREEVASFVAEHGHCLLYNERFAEAVEVYRLAVELAPDDPHYVAFLCSAEAMSGSPIPVGHERFEAQVREEREHIRKLNHSTVTLELGAKGDHIV